MSERRGTTMLAVLGLLAGCAQDEVRRTPTTAAAAAPAPAAAASEGTRCFAPLPGHPTPAERRAFVDEISRLATEAEARHGVPAAAIAAMAIQESGYGWTELAQETNNLLAWKHTDAEAAGGRDAWTLNCGDVSDRYIVFADRAEAVDFVARQLAGSDNYGADTARYREDRADGGDVAAAVDRWVDGIADPYSSDPEAYRTALRRIMNDPYDPSDRRAPEASLYRLSESARPPRPAA